MFSCFACEPPYTQNGPGRRRRYGNPWEHMPFGRQVCICYSLETEIIAHNFFPRAYLDNHNKTWNCFNFVG